MEDVKTVALGLAAIGVCCVWAPDSLTFLEKVNL